MDHRVCVRIKLGHFVHSLIQKHSLSSRSGPGTILGGGETAVNKGIYRKKFKNINNGYSERIIQDSKQTGAKSAGGRGVGGESERP